MEEIANFAINPRDTHIVTFTKNSMIRYIKIEEKKIVHSQKIAGFFGSEILFDQSGALLVVGDPRGIVNIFELKTFKIIQQFKAHDAGLLGMRLISTKSTFNLYTFGRDRKILVYDIKQAEAIRSFSISDITINNIAVDEQGEYLFASGFDNNIHVWKCSSGKYAGSIRSDLQLTTLEVLSFTLVKEQQSKTIIFGGTEKGLVQAWNFNPSDISESKKSSFITDNKHEIMNIKILREQKKIVVVNHEKDVYVFKLKSFKDEEPIFQLEEELMGFNDMILDLKFVKNTKTTMDNLLVVAANSETLRLYNYENKSSTFIPGHSEMVLCIDVWNNYVLSGSKDNTIKLWEIVENTTNNVGHTFKLKCTFRGHQSYIISLCFAPKNGSFFISGSEDKTVKKWVLVDQIFKSANPKIMKQAQRTVVSHEKQVNVVRISLDSKIAASASHDKKIVIYDTKDMSTKHSFKAHKRGIWDMAFSPFEKVLVSCGGDKLIKIWSLDDASLLFTLEGHVTTVLKVNWATLGSQLLSASADGLIKIWNYRKGI